MFAGLAFLSCVLIVMFGFVIACRIINRSDEKRLAEGNLGCSSEFEYGAWSVLSQRIRISVVICYMSRSSSHLDLSEQSSSLGPVSSRE